MKGRYVYFATAAFLAGALLLAAGFWLGRPSSSEQGMASSTPRTIYVVHEFSWRFRARGNPLVLDDGSPGRPVKAFVDRGLADAHCRQLNREKRGNPFRYLPEGLEGGGGSFLDHYATRGEANFRAFLRTEGLTPPDPEPSYPSSDFDDCARAWGDWWEQHFKEWDGGLVERLWEALDRVRFYEVVEVAVQP